MTRCIRIVKSSERKLPRAALLKRFKSRQIKACVIENPAGCLEKRGKIANPFSCIHYCNDWEYENERWVVQGHNNSNHRSCATDIEFFFCTAKTALCFFWIAMATAFIFDCWDFLSTDPCIWVICLSQTFIRILKMSQKTRWTYAKRFYTRSKTYLSSESANNLGQVKKSMLSHPIVSHTFKLGLCR